MPFKSESQRRKFGELVKSGKMSKQTFNEWNKDTPSELPERIGKTKTIDNGVPKKNIKGRFGL